MRRDADEHRRPRAVTRRHEWLRFVNTLDLFVTQITAEEQVTNLLSILPLSGYAH
jgi:hypothetical protein